MRVVLWVWSASARLVQHQAVLNRMILLVLAIPASALCEMRGEGVESTNIWHNRFCSIPQDITDAQRRKEAEMRQREAEAATAAQATISAHVYHEIRNVVSKPKPVLCKD